MSALVVVLLLLVAAGLCLYARSHADMEISGFLGFWFCLIGAVVVLLGGAS